MSDEIPKCHPGVAAVLSFIFNGLGHLYVGEIKQGLIIMTATSTCLIVIILGAVLIFHWLLTHLLPISELILGSVIFILGIIAACTIGAYSITDAYQKALKK